MVRRVTRAAARGHARTQFDHLTKPSSQIEMYRMTGDFLTITDLRKLLKKTDKDPLLLIIAGIPDKGSPLDLSWEEGGRATYSFWVKRADLESFLSQYPVNPRYKWTRETAIQYLASSPDFTPTKPLEEYSTPLLKRYASFYKRQEQESILPFAEGFSHINWLHVDTVAVGLPEAAPYAGKRYRGKRAK